MFGLSSEAGIYLEKPRKKCFNQVSCEKGRAELAGASSIPARGCWIVLAPNKSGKFFHLRIGVF